LGHPLTATSANPSGRDPSLTIAEARRYFSGKLEVFLDGGRLAGRKGSTVVEVFQDELRTIREGEISREELARALAPAH
jgi:tRNA A37 threonylcarbamoyladenosine synthetase subunit TsaC/SUA5/YrdC